MNGKKGIRAIVLAREKLQQLKLFQAVKESRMFLDYFLLGLGAPASVGLFGGQLVQSIEIFHRALELPKRMKHRSQTRHFFDIGLGAVAI
jgi:hypothetical protein